MSQGGVYRNVYTKDSFRSMTAMGVVCFGAGLATLRAPARFARIASFGGRRNHHNVWAAVSLIPPLLFVPNLGADAKRRSNTQHTLVGAGGLYAGLSVAAVISVCALRNQILFAPICIPFNACLALESFGLSYLLKQ